MNKRFYLIFVGMVLLGVMLGWTVAWAAQSYLGKFVVSDDAKTQVLRVSVTVVDNGYTFNFSLDDPYTRVLFWQGAGQMLSTAARPNVDWEITLGHEDNPSSQGTGDYTDVMLKMAKLSTAGIVQYEVACLGSFVKKIYFDGTLKLDTSTGARWATWSV